MKPVTRRPPTAPAILPPIIDLLTSEEKDRAACDVPGADAAEGYETLELLFVWWIIVLVIDDVGIQVVVDSICRCCLAAGFFLQ